MKACIDIGGTKVAVSLNTGANAQTCRRAARTHRQDRQQRRAGAAGDPHGRRGCAEDVGVDPGARAAVGVSSCGPLRAEPRPGRTGRAQHLRRPGRPGARPAQRLDDGHAGGAAAPSLRPPCGSRTTHRRAGSGAPLGRAAGRRPLRLRHLEHRHRHGPVRGRPRAARQERQRRPCRPHVRERQRRRLVRLRQRRRRGRRWSPATPSRAASAPRPRRCCSAPVPATRERWPSSTTCAA
jgi:hypothetical protein